MTHGLDFGLFFFGHMPDYQDNPYDLVRAATTLADDAGLSFVSTPERHFDSFGGAFPAPAVLGAALAAITDRISVRAGSVITPLHDVVRVVEDWSVVNVLSGGRCAISLGSGWSVNDFVLADPDRYTHRKTRMLDNLATIRSLWAGEPEARINAAGQEFAFRTYPRPRTPIPIWLTTGGADESFELAGRHGCHILTHLERQSIEVLTHRIRRYRQALADAGHDPDTGIVTLMQHTHLCHTDDQLRQARTGLRSYLLAALALEEHNLRRGGASSGGSPISLRGSNSHDTETIVELAVERYLNGAALIGSPTVCLQRCHTLIAAGVNEIACLVDFLPDRNAVLAAVRDIAALAGRLRPEALEAARKGLTERFAGLDPLST